MVKGKNNKMYLSEATVRQALTEYMNRRLINGVKVVVTTVWEASRDDHEPSETFGLWVHEVRS